MNERNLFADDPKSYGRLLARRLPGVVRTEQENERRIAELEQLDQRHSELIPEEREHSELLTVLIEAFENANYSLEGSTASSRLRGLMEDHRLRQRNLLDVFGSRGIALWFTPPGCRFTELGRSCGALSRPWKPNSLVRFDPLAMTFEHRPIPSVGE